MSKATDVVEALTSRPLSSKQILERREATMPHTKLIASAGQVLAHTPIPTQAPRLIEQMPVGTTD